MRAQRTNPDTHCRATCIGVHYLLGLVEHLHLLLGVAVRLEHIYLRNYIICQLVSKLFNGLYLTFLNHLLILLLQFCHRCSACPRSTLVRSNVDTLDVRNVLKRLQTNNHHYSGAVRIGDNTARTLQRILCITLGNHQWHILIHAERTRIVNHDSAIFRDILCKFLACTSTSRRKRDVNVAEIIVVLQQFHLNLLTAEGVLGACRTLGTEQH